MPNVYNGIFNMENDSRDAFSYKEFCKRHSISLSYLYDLIKTGKGPRILRIGDRRLITAESAREWRNRFEEQAAA